MSRKKSRELLFKMVFELCFQKPEGVDEDLFALDSLDEENKEFILSMYEGIKNNFDEIVSVVEKHLKGYTLDRVFKIDLAILIMAVYEIKYVKETPINVVINEAVELAKKYSTEKSYSFINGVLANVVKE